MRGPESCIFCTIFASLELLYHRLLGEVLVLAGVQMDIWLQDCCGQRQSSVFHHLLKVLQYIIVVPIPLLFKRV